MLAGSRLTYRKFNYARFFLVKTQDTFQSRSFSILYILEFLRIIHTSHRDCLHLTSFCQSTRMFEFPARKLCLPEVYSPIGSLITHNFSCQNTMYISKYVDLLAFDIFCLFFRVLEDNPHQPSGIDIQSMQTFKRWIKSPWSVKCLVKALPPLRNCWFVSFFLYKKL